MADLISTDIPGYQNFVRMPLAVFNHTEKCIHHHIKEEVTKFRKPLEVGLKLAITLRHLATPVTSKSLQYNWLVGQTNICKFIPIIYRTTLAEFQEEYLIYCTTREDWKQTEENFRTRSNVAQAVGLTDEKHVATKKTNKSGSEFYNYKGFLSLVLLALVDNEYRFLWVDVVSSGSSTDGQLFNCCKLKEKLKNATLGLPSLEPPGKVGLLCTSFCWVMMSTP